MMRETDFSLGESVFVLQKPHVYLHSRTTIQVLFKDEYRDTPSNECQLLQPFHSLFTRSMNIRWSLCISFADDLEPEFLACEDIDKVVAGHLEDAEVRLQRVWSGWSDTSSGGSSSNTRYLTLKLRAGTLHTVVTCSWTLI